MILQMVKFKKCLIFKIVKFWKFVKFFILKNWKNLIGFQISQSEKFGKLANFPNLKFLGMRVRISKSKYENSKIYQFLESNFGFSNWKKISNYFPNFRMSKIIKFLLSTNSQNNQISEISEFRKSANYQNLTIYWSIKIPKISYLMGNYHVSWEFK